MSKQNYNKQKQQRLTNNHMPLLQYNTEMKINYISRISFYNLFFSNEKKKKWKYVYVF